MITVDQIRIHLRDVANEKLPLDSFDEWLVSASWNMHRDSTPEAIRMAAKIELLLAEFDEGQVAEKELRAIFEQMASTFEITNEAPPQTVLVTSGLNSEPILFTFPWLSWAGAGTRPEKESSCTPLRPVTR